DRSNPGSTRRSFQRRRRVPCLNGLWMIGALRTVHPSMRSAHLLIGSNLRINMNSYSNGRRSHRSRGGSRRRGNSPARRQREEAKEPKKTFWQRIAAFFGNGTARAEATARNGAQPSRPARKPERIEVSSPRLYVGNLSFDATESDLCELFNGVGHVQNAEVVSYRHNERSKGFATVKMQTHKKETSTMQESPDKDLR